MPITDPALPPEERMKTLAAVALGLSPMHPDTYKEIRAEYDECERLTRPEA